MTPPAHLCPVMDTRSLTPSPATGRAPLADWHDALRNDQLRLVADVCARNHQEPRP